MARRIASGSDGHAVTMRGQITIVVRWRSPLNSQFWSGMVRGPNYCSRSKWVTDGDEK